jgi:rod shape-determining protein MreD
MRWLRFAVLILLVTVLQKGLLARWDNKPDLVLIVMVFSAIHFSTSDAIISSFAAGLAADLIGSPMPMGPHIISFGVFGTLLAYLHRVVAIRRMPYQGAAIFATGLLVGALTHALAFLTGSEPFSKSIYAAVCVTSLYSAFVGPFLFLPAVWWMGIKTDRRRHRFF